MRISNHPPRMSSQFYCLQRDTSLAKMTQHMLHQLIELYRLRSYIRMQEEYYLNAIRNQQMLTDKILTQLSLTDRSIHDFQGGCGHKNYQQQYRWLSGSIAHFMEDITCLVQNYSLIKSEWEQKVQQQSLEASEHEHLIEKCSEKFNQARSIIEAMTYKNQEKATVIDQMALEIQQCSITISELEQNKCWLERENSELLKDKNIQQSQLAKSHETCKLLEVQLETALNNSNNKNPQNSQLDKQIVYLKQQTQQLTSQNEQLTNLHRQQLIKLSQLQHSLSKKTSQAVKLRAQHCQLQRKCGYIIDSEERIKMMEGNRTTKGGEKQNGKGQQLDRGGRKFNLQTLQKRACLADHTFHN